MEREKDRKVSYQKIILPGSFLFFIEHIIAIKVIPVSGAQYSNSIFVYSDIVK